MSTYSLCFGSKKRKMYTPANPSFPMLKWGFRGYTLHGHVFLMAMTKMEHVLT